MNKFLSTLSLLLLMLITGCNGSSGENPTDSDEVSVATSISVVLLNNEGVEQLSFDTNDNVTVQATVKDQFNAVMSGTRVNYSADLGSLSVDSKLTDSNGVATITILNSDLILSAGTLTASVASAESSISTSIDYEYTTSTVVAPSLSASIAMQLNGQNTNQFKSNEQAQIQVTLLDNTGAGVKNEIINFAADIGSLTTTTALTNENGQAIVTLAGDDVIGAGVIAVSLNSNSSISAQMNYQILPADTVLLDDVRIGYFDENSQFIEGAIKLSITDQTISAGGTLGLTVELVDSENKYINTPTTVSFTSNCVINETATIDETVISIKGKAGATFEDINCAGINGTEDIIVASVTSNGVTNTASTNINISSEELGSIEFVSSQPDSIVIKGSGGQETSTLTFLLKSQLGNPLAQQEVEFSLDTIVGGIALSRASGFTNSQGLITTQVSSGTVPTVVRVTAKAIMEVNGETISVQTQSSELSVNTGLPEQASMTIAATVLNPEADIVGQESVIRVWLADSFNNPVPDGTPINFTTEGGTIESSCNTVAGNCAVTWTATEPYLTDHRSTILATTSGHETFFDSNGDNVFDNNDGDAINNNMVNSGFGRQVALSAGFVDMSEAWRDDNENHVKDPQETKFFDQNNDDQFSLADEKFNGPQCSGDKCDNEVKNAILRKALVLIMSSSSNPNFVLSDTTQTTTYADNQETSNNLPDVADGSALALRFRFADSAMQTMPIGTTVTVTLDGGELQGTTTISVGNTNADGFSAMDFSINNPIDGDPATATLTISIETPNTLATTYVTKSINLL
ncbi:Ig-like domain-containing protein [Thalassotalea castellviae]|uniref:Ig-like domain-containing protein n=1 Tax=Thalassotalea castellviae TaxID=3075612 RepID=A0ABU2ZZX2_9GAMM|nr:Ig-like domain-containing protein [Thalassotalea sp. W431]MDT0603473.1 Ig-like domain-containing protein [Thalassotalea sp. W431]